MGETEIRKNFFFEKKGIINLQEMNAECTICTETIKSDGRTVSAILCGHMFHRKCLKPALQSRSHCPNCRTPAGPNNVIKKLYFNQSSEDEDSEWDDSDFGSDEVETTEPYTRNYDVSEETLDELRREAALYHQSVPIGRWYDNDDTDNDEIINLTIDLDSIKTLSICSGWIVDGLTINGTTSGGNGGPVFTLDAGEKLTTIEGSYYRFENTDCIGRIKLTTSTGRTFGPFGHNGNPATSPNDHRGYPFRFHEENGISVINTKVRQIRTYPYTGPPKPFMVDILSVQ